MKLISFFTLFMSVAVAHESAGPEGRVVNLRRQAPRSNKFTLDYTTSISTPTDQRSKATLHQAPQTQRRQVTANDFFECTNPNPSPSSADCNVIVNQVLSTSQDFLIDANTCLAFSFRTCQAFFCSLCQTLATSSDFIGSQLDTVAALCVENGQAGTIVGEDVPQWDAGFVYAGQSLPTYDVC
ncbi:hypothetical protein C8A03DRAFT_16179 [Achaetomium macrosporum]|uniref:Uncharacterized protein n=1 Tax=Achaetomium macrosporum TaxID=79813 RepID=A0AAN7C8D1_9PEZI|nr:hypothetical protein C8A03DRAFT_16179 [Achaetomium macrosporum]